MTKEALVANTLKCGDLMPGCTAVIEGKDVMEVMTKAAAHAAKDHMLTNITPDMIQKVKAAIKET